MPWWRFTKYRHDRRRRRRPSGQLVALVGIFLIAVAYSAGRSGWPGQLLDHAPGSPGPTPAPHAAPISGGQILGVDAVQTFSPTEAENEAHQNYGAATLPAKNGAIKVTFHYRSRDLDGSPLIVYGRAYIPTTGGKYPIFAFAPGTTGIGDQCAASLENPHVANWANYDSHLLMYASQGYVGVTTDYEGMRDPSRIHHYMVGELEGRALLDAVRALSNLPQARDHIKADQVVVGGYSQGGHAAFWADTINAKYAPDVSIKGVVGFGPVLNVRQSIAEVTAGSSLNWFGPYVLASYSDYYHRDYDIATILQPQYAANLSGDVQSHCIDSDIAFWGHDPNKVYTPAFLSSINSDHFAADYPVLASDLARNAVGTEATASAKLINQGKFDNVVLPRQAQDAHPAMCRASRGAVALKLYDGTHYNTMVLSLRDTLEWMRQVDDGKTTANTCS